jgi:hypothetical protein
MYLPEQIGNKHIRVSFSFDHPEQSRLQDCDMSQDEITNWISQCFGGEIQGGTGSYLISVDGYAIHCETEINVRFKRKCDRCGKILDVSLRGKTTLQYIPENKMYETSTKRSSTKKGTRKKNRNKNPAKDYASDSDGIQLQLEDLEIGFYDPSGVSCQQILSEMTILITPTTIRCIDISNDSDKQECIIDQDEKEVFTNNPFANF